MAVNSNLDLWKLFSLISELQNKVRHIESSLDCQKPSRPVKCKNWKPDQHTRSRCLETPFMHPTTRDADADLRAEAHPIALVSKSFMKPVTVKLPLTVTSIGRSPLCIGQFVWSR